MPAGGRVVLNNHAIEELLAGRNGAVARWLEHQAERVTQDAKRRCPVSPVGASDHPSGQLRSSIGWSIEDTGRALRAEVGTDLDYGLYVEVGTGPHTIRSHGDYPLRNRKGQVFGREVHHPGTPAQPYLRPALDIVDGRP